MTPLILPGAVALEDGNPSIQDAFDFVDYAYRGLVDKVGEPYITHLLRVLRRLGPGASRETKITALLHDVLEDTPATADDLVEGGYPAVVVDAVRMLTRPENLAYLDWIRYIAASGNEIAIRVKIADNEDNSAPERIAALPIENRDIAYRYARSLAILRPALRALEDGRG